MERRLEQSDTHWVGSLRMAAPDRSSLQSNRYSLLPCDLRALNSSDALEKIQNVLDPNKDTMILAECVLAYLSPKESATLLRNLSNILQKPFAICYEMCVAGETTSAEAEPDKLGAVMLTNLQVRICTMIAFNLLVMTELVSHHRHATSSCRALELIQL